MAKKGSTKKKEAKKTKPKSTKKGYFLIVPVIIIICIIGLLWFTLAPESAKAQLIIDSGTVQIKHAGESWTSAEDGMDLYQSDSVKTGEDSSATIILFGSSIIRLDSNTEVTLQEIIQQEEETSVKIKQDAGRTWNTVMKISGIDDYEVQTPTTVASVRGTTFDVTVDNESGISIVNVIKGAVNVTGTDNGTVYTVQLNENWSITVGLDEMGEQQPFDLDDWILNNLLKDEAFKEDLKNILYERIEPYIDDLKDLYGMTDEEIEVLIDNYIAGKFSIPPETPDEFKDLFDLSS